MSLIVYDPKLAVEQVKSAKLIVSEMRRDVLRKDIDFGVIPGTSKPTLLKPGAEKLCTAFGLCPQFEAVSQIEDFEKGIFYYRYRCTLVHIETGKAIATGIGSCNSKEDKYRWRNEECPHCKKQRITKSKFADRNTGEIGWYCGACKANFPADAFTGAREENVDPFSLINTIDKMGQKRALIAAVLIGTNASEFFTQDIEDLPQFADDDVIEGEYMPAPPQPAPKSAPRPAQPKPAPTQGEPAEQHAESPERPYSVDALVTALNDFVNSSARPGATSGTLTPKQAQGLAIKMGEHMTDETRKYFIKRVFGKDTSKTLCEKQMLAITAWLAKSDPQVLESEISSVIVERKASTPQEAPEAEEMSDADQEFNAIGEK